MILVIALAAAVVVTVVRGGRLSRLATLRFRLWGLLLAALAVQVLVISVLPAALPAAAAAALHVLSYALAAAFVVGNLAVPGLWLLALGGATNLLAIAANGGVMPASAAAMRLAGRVTPAGRFANSRVLPHPRLAALGDVLAVPHWVPLANVFSPGDVLLVAGGALLIDRACRVRPAARTSGAPGALTPVLPGAGTRGAAASNEVAALDAADS